MFHLKKSKFMKVKKIDLHSLQNEEHTGFHTYVSTYLQEEMALMQKIPAKVRFYISTISIEKSLLDMIRQNSFTEELDTAEAGRDKPIKGFMRIVKGMQHHFDPATAEAAYRVQLINDNFSDITRLADKKQTMAEEKYITTLKAVAPDVQLLGLTQWVQEIERTHLVYIETDKKRNDEADNQPEGNMKSARLETDKAYMDIIETVNAYITLEGEASYASFVTKVNNRIDDFATAIARRRGKNKQEGEKEG